MLNYYECFLENGKLYIVTDYCDQGDLEHLINRHVKSKTRIPEDQIWDIVLQTLNGLKCIHQHRILHRDIKAQNVLIQQNTYKIADFGVSKVLHRPGELAKTQIGTPYYLSPEIWRREAYSTKTDIYSLGCLYYELCTGKHPFNGRDMNELQRAVLNGHYQPISSFYSQGLREMIYAMLSPKPKVRLTISAILNLPAVQ